MTELRPFVVQALRAEVEKIRKVQTEQLQAQVTTQVVTDLETNIVDVIKQTVSADGVDLDDTRSLVQLIIERLRPVIFEAVKKALQSSAFEIDANDLTIRIIIGRKHALKKYDQFTLNTSCFWRSTGSNITPVFMKFLLQK